MNEKLFLFLFFLSMVLISCGTNTLVKNIDQSSSFEEVGHFSSGRYGHASVSLDNNIYIIGGAQKNLAEFSSSIEKFDVVSKSFQKLPSPIIGRRYLGAVVADSNIYIIGGEKIPENLPVPTNILSQTTGILEKYDLRTNKVVTLSEMPNPRQYMGVVEHKGKIYVIGGSQYSTKDHYRHRPTRNNYVDIQPNDKGTTIPTITEINSTSHQTKYLASIDIYDIKSDTWTKGPSMPTARECKATLYKNKIYVIGGYNGNALDNVEIFNIDKGIWEESKDAPISISAYSSLEKNGLIYFFGDYKELNMVMIYNPEINEWSKIESNFQGCRHNASITCMDNIYIVGGNITTKLNTTLNVIQKYKGI